MSHSSLSSAAGSKSTGASSPPYTPDSRPCPAAKQDPCDRGTLLPIVERCDNCTLPAGPFGPLEHLATWQDAQRRGAGRDGEGEGEGEVLVPFYLAAPTHLPGSRAIAPVATPVAPERSRRTSSQSSQRRPAVHSLSRYLPRPDPHGGFEAAFEAQAELRERYTPEQRALDASAPVGFPRPAVVGAMLLDMEKMVRMQSKPCWKALYPEAACEPGGRAHAASALDDDDDDDGPAPPCGPWAMAFEDWINESPDRKRVRWEHMDRMCRTWKELDRFPDVLGGWRNEEYDIYGPAALPPSHDLGAATFPAPSSPSPFPPAPRRGLPGANVAFRMERAATSLFGFSTFGVHLTAYTRSDAEASGREEYRFWVPRRSLQKPTWPGYLDNTVAGGIAAGDSPMETMVRECAEEASLGREVLEGRLKSAGLVAYCFRGEGGWIQPETEYVYDLELPADGSIAPAPNDGEAIDFRLLTQAEVLDGIWRGEWKPNCAVVMVDFLVRHGLVSAETDGRYVELCARLRRPAPLPRPL